METQSKVIEILETFGLKDKKAAEFMGISSSLFAAKKNGFNYNKFKKEDLHSLIANLKAKADELP